MGRQSSCCFIDFLCVSAVTLVETVSVSAQQFLPTLRSVTAEGFISAGGPRSSVVCQRQTTNTCPNLTAWYKLKHLFCVLVKRSLMMYVCVHLILCSSAVWERAGVWPLWSSLLYFMSKCKEKSSFTVWSSLLCGGLLLPSWHCPTRWDWFTKLS